MLIEFNVVIKVYDEICLDENDKLAENIKSEFNQILSNIEDLVNQTEFNVHSSDWYEL
jgi:hypothetical protein